MHVLRNSEDSRRIAIPSIRALIDLRFSQLANFHDGLLIVVEAGDSVDELETVGGIPLLHDPFEDVPFGHPDFTPSFDYLEAHYANGSITCYEAHADTSDDGTGVTFFIPAEDGIDRSLLAMLKRYAVPADGLMEP